MPATLAPGVRLRLAPPASDSKEIPANDRPGDEDREANLGREYLRTTCNSGTEGEHAIDIEKLRSTTGHITLDEGYRSTGSCVSNVTFIDGEAGILRYRGIPIEQLAAKSSFIETAWLLIWVSFPQRSSCASFEICSLRTS